MADVLMLPLVALFQRRQVGPIFHVLPRVDPATASLQHVRILRDESVACRPRARRPAGEILLVLGEQLAHEVLRNVRVDGLHARLGELSVQGVHRVRVDARHARGLRVEKERGVVPRGAALVPGVHQRAAEGQDGLRLHALAHAAAPVRESGAHGGRRLGPRAPGRRRVLADVQYPQELPVEGLPLLGLLAAAALPHDVLVVSPLVRVLPDDPVPLPRVDARGVLPHHARPRPVPPEPDVAGAQEVRRRVPPRVDGAHGAHRPEVVPRVDALQECLVVVVMALRVHALRPTERVPRGGVRRRVRHHRRIAQAVPAREGWIDCRGSLTVTLTLALTSPPLLLARGPPGLLPRQRGVGLLVLAALTRDGIEVNLPPGAAVLSEARLGGGILRSPNWRPIGTVRGSPA
mmetsp:Transcript_122245/g.346558  ORF Transcript_122245/g.346558 Transcript_122245/m.346558 type:complete len:405 (+) Transcript_122245:743-1957(+)